MLIVKFLERLLTSRNKR